MGQTHRKSNRDCNLDSLTSDEQDSHGFSFISGIPSTPEATEALIRRIAFIRETHYGGFWDFTADLKHGDLAYSDQELRGHTDTTYFSDVRARPDSTLCRSRLTLRTALRITTLPSSLSRQLTQGWTQPPHRRLPRRRHLPSIASRTLPTLLNNVYSIPRLRNRFFLLSFRRLHGTTRRAACLHARYSHGRISTSALERRRSRCRWRESLGREDGDVVRGGAGVGGYSEE